MKTTKMMLSAARVAAVTALLAAGACEDQNVAPAPSGLTAVANAAVGAQPLPDIEQGPLRIEPGGFDFGAIAPDSTHEVRFTLTNTGDAPVKILRLSSTCLCTAPENIADQVIAAGGSLSFSAGFDAPTETGPKGSQMVLSFESGGQRHATQLHLRGLITMAIRAEPTYIDALKRVTNGVIRITSLDGRPFRVLSSNGQTPEHADGFSPARDTPRSVYDIAWHVPEREVQNCAGARLWWIIETDHPECPILPLRIRHECTGSLSDPDRMQRGWMFGEGIVPLGAIRAGEPVEVNVEVFNRNNVAITGVESLSPDATAQLVSFGRGEGTDSICRVRFTPASTARGMLYAMVLFKSPTGVKDVAFVAKVEP